jgi:hypothetical protein
VKAVTVLNRLAKQVLIDRLQSGIANAIMMQAFDPKGATLK